MTSENRRRAPGRLQVWRRHWRQAWAQAWQLLWEKPLESLLTLLVMALASLPAALLWLASQQLQSLTLHGQGDWLVFMPMQADGQQAEKLAQALRALPQVAEVQVRSPKAVLEDYLSGTGLEQGLAQKAGGLFPWVVEVRAQTGLPAEQSARLAEQWQKQWPERIDSIAHDPAWQSLRQHLSTLIDRVLFWVVLLSAIALFFVVSNTVHLRLRRHQSAIEVMRVLGADDVYLRRPYLLASLLGGLFAGLLGGLLTILLLLSLQGPWQALRDALALPPATSTELWATLLLWPLLLALLSLVSARLSLRQPGQT